MGARLAVHRDARLVRLEPGQAQPDVTKGHVAEAFRAGPFVRTIPVTAPERSAGQAHRAADHSLSVMRAVQITRFGGPEVLDVVDLPDPVPGEGEQLYEVTAAGINFADPHHSLP